MTVVVQVTTSVFAEADRTPLKMLREAGCEVRLNPHQRKLSVDESRALLGDVDGLIAGTEQINAEVLSAAPRLKVVSRVGAGLDSVDRTALERAGVALFATSDAHVDAVAELALHGLLAGFRRGVISDRALRQGHWQRSMGRLLSGKTVGLVGLGRVARRLTALMQPFGVQLLASDPYWDEAYSASARIERVELDDLCARAHAISLQVPGNAGVLIGAKQIARLRPDVVLVNTARGGLIDEAVLAAFLKTHPEAFAALDVFAEEPYQGPLAALDNTLLTAHLGGYALESRVAMETQAVQNCLRGMGLLS